MFRLRRRSQANREQAGIAALAYSGPINRWDRCNVELARAYRDWGRHFERNTSKEAPPTALGTLTTAIKTLEHPRLAGD
jgi:hypothetical protein